MVDEAPDDVRGARDVRDAQKRCRATGRRSACRPRGGSPAPPAAPADRPDTGGRDTKRGFPRVRNACPHDRARRTERAAPARVEGGVRRQGR